MREKIVKFSPRSINEFLECPTEVENGIFDEGFEYSEEVVIEITSGKCSIWGLDSQLSASLSSIMFCSDWGYVIGF